jgi:predicted transcriptional regulator
MHFSRTELQTIAELAKGNTSIGTVAKALNKSEKHIYRIVQKLEEKDLAALSFREIVPRKSTLMVRLTRILDSYPNLIPVLADSGIPILVSLLEAKNVDEITEDTSAKKSTVYAFLKKALKISLVKKDGERYVLNEKIWGEVPDLLREIRDIERLLDPRVPYNSVIYYRNKGEVIYSNKYGGDSGEKTGFSVFEKEGIKLLLPTTYYYYSDKEPEKELTKEDIFRHALYVAEKEASARHLIFLALFYCKFEKELKDVKHQIVENLKIVLKGDRIRGYPAFEEIKEKADMYGIEIMDGEEFGEVERLSEEYYENELRKYES